MFAPFTNEEVESIRSIVRLEQQKDDMLLSNCSTRPLPQVRSFIRRFKRSLLDAQTPTKDIAMAANEQYVAIIAGVRIKRNNRSLQMKSAKSVANLASPLYQTMKTMPLKFRAKYARNEAENEPAPTLPPPLPTRSRSISEGLSLIVQQQQQTKIPILPPLNRTLPRACSSASELKFGSLAALPSGNGPAFVCRVLGSKKIMDKEYILVSFFQPDITPCYVPPQNLVKLMPASSLNTFDLPNPISVDTILEQLMQTSSYVVNEIPPSSNDPITQEKHKYIQFKSVACASQLIFLDYAANNRIPPDKMKLILDSFPKMNPLKYSSSEAINNRCKELIQQILSGLD
ncbi:hypothetical protein GPJ56_003669 [Histomonas meleagridis]|uniref:uncharacterized protein n=1 Tax=Histomonas meleagridis TaxID=135588 RepID=UPI00355AADE1|nr:hypothetical protein GPJ56_003669 [Histomonas meleagridis]KAH0806246.1 hypothetical protein GO595_000934 [Histomonas meleagridis]